MRRLGDTTKTRNPSLKMSPINVETKESLQPSYQRLCINNGRLVECQHTAVVTIHLLPQQPRHSTVTLQALNSHSPGTRQSLPRHSLQQVPIASTCPQQQALPTSGAQAWHVGAAGAARCVACSWYPSPSRSKAHRLVPRGPSAHSLDASAGLKLRWLTLATCLATARRSAW